jgi:hypothetical protein
VIYRDDGLGSDIDTEVNSVADINVRNLPSLDQFTITSFPASSEGRTFRFQIEVITTQRSTLSDISFIVLASEPLKPLETP